jgi:toxin ParE1/3/4
MARVSWTSGASRDFDEICEYLAKTSGSFAQHVTRSVEGIPDQPYLGAAVSEYGQEDVRERQYLNYRVIYRLRDENVEVLTIIHGARRLPRTPPG